MGWGLSTRIHIMKLLFPRWTISKLAPFSLLPGLSLQECWLRNTQTVWQGHLLHVLQCSWDFNKIINLQQSLALVSCQGGAGVGCNGGASFRHVFSEQGGIFPESMGVYCNLPASSCHDLGSSLFVRFPTQSDCRSSLPSSQEPDVCHALLALW